MVVSGTPMQGESVKRPKTRAECADVPRPCPFASCRYSTRIDVGKHHLRVYREELQESEDPLVDVPADTSCALDVAERGEHLLEEVGEVLECTKQRAEQVEKEALLRLRKKFRDAGIDLRDLFGRSSDVIPEVGEYSIGPCEDIQGFVRDMKPLPAYPFRRVAETADGRRVGDAAPGKLVKRGRFYKTFYQRSRFLKGRAASSGE